ncbi:MAG: SPOR domain-containing protein [Bradyrhizobium sp.]
MADRYRDRPFPADNDYDRGGDPEASARGESDPLAELARLIGQTDPFGSTGRANQQVPPRTSARDSYQQRAAEPVYQRPAEPPYQRPAEPDVGPPAGPPPWMQRANRQELPQQEPPPDYPSSVHPLQRYAAARPAPEPEYQEEPQYADEPEPDPSRYDDALYGQLDAGAQPFPHDPAYADDAYAYRDGYDDGAEEPEQKRRGGMVTVIVVLALAVIGTGAAFAYRTYVGTPRTGEPPVIRADTSPTKIVPAPSDGSAKLPDRMATGDGTEKIVPREEAPVDVNAKAGPRVVFPPLNQNGNPPSVASVAPSNLPPPSAGNGTMPNNEPRKIRTLTVKGEQPDGTTLPAGATPPAAAKQPPAARTATAPLPTAGHNPPTSANASANAPLSLVPQGNQAAPAADPQTRVANTNPVQAAPAPAPAGGGYMVQVSSQRSEADAQASFRALQGKFPAVLGAHSPSIKRADLGEKGVYYRAMVGPFGSSEEASQFCGNLKSAGGQCVVQRN